MPEIDYIQILLGFIGGSGLMGLIVSYMELSQERKQRAREQFRELVLTSDFRNLLRSIQMTLYLLRAVVKQERGGRANVVIGDKVRQLKGPEDWKPELEELTRHVLEINNKFQMTGSILFIPDPLREKIHSAIGCVADLIESKTLKNLTSARESLEEVRL
jgi:hypothetical protein